MHPTFNFAGYTFAASQVAAVGPLFEQASKGGSKVRHVFHVYLAGMEDPWVFNAEKPGADGQGLRAAPEVRRDFLEQWQYSLANS